MLYPSFINSSKPNQQYNGAIYANGAGLIIVNASLRNQFTAAGWGQALDTAPGGFDGSSLLLAKTAGIVLTLTGTTPITIDLTALAAATGVVVAGATSFSNWNHILWTNIGTTALAIAPGASNPIRNQLGGTSPTLTPQASDVVHWVASAGLAVDSTHKTFTVTPTSGGSMLVWIGGS